MKNQPTPAATAVASFSFPQAPYQKISQTSDANFIWGDSKYQAPQDSVIMLPDSGFGLAYCTNDACRIFYSPQSSVCEVQ